jgi:hypothetical protein
MRSAGAADRTAAALGQLAEALRQTIDELEVLVRRAEHLRDEVATGRPLHETMAAEDRPLIITQLVTITDRLHEAGGAVRRTEARQLLAGLGSSCATRAARTSRSPRSSASRGSGPAPC